MPSATTANAHVTSGVVDKPPNQMDFCVINGNSVQCKGRQMQSAYDFVLETEHQNALVCHNQQNYMIEY